MDFKLFYVVSLFLVAVIFYDFYKLTVAKYWKSKKTTESTERKNIIKLKDFHKNEKKKTEQESNVM